MRQFAFIPTEIAGLTLIQPFVAWDQRGYLVKDYAAEAFRGQQLAHPLEEVFYTGSQAGVVRAIHFQREKQQAKLVRCVSGKIYDVVVDLRKGSPTFGRWLGFDLEGDNFHSLYIPGGCGHGYLVLEASVVSYKCDEKFYGEYDDGIRWDDPDVGVAWPVHLVHNIIVSDKDKNLQTFRAFQDRYGGLA